MVYLQVPASQVSITDADIVLFTIPETAADVQATGIDIFVINGRFIVLKAEPEPGPQDFPQLLVKRSVFLPVNT